MSLSTREMTSEEIDNLQFKEIRDREQFALSDQNIESLLNYTNFRIPPGSFMRSVLENDLLGALGRADVWNRRKLFEYCEWLWNYAPPESFGSPEKVDRWLAQGIVRKT